VIAVKQSPIEIKVMPSLKKQVGDKHPKAEEVILFDEEREQQLLEEAKKKKERAKKMRE
jgi:hypothetical protein